MKLIDKSEVKNFFDKLAPVWDAEQVDRSRVIGEILDISEVKSGTKVLDVACGTGILFPYYLERDVELVTGIDISPEMIKLAIDNVKRLNAESVIEPICADVEEVQIESVYDAAVVYNAYPHFPDGERLVEKLSKTLCPMGRLTIAHGFSRDTINKHHSGSASCVSLGLEDATVLAKKFEKYFVVDVIISDDEKYIVSGFRKPLK